MKKEHTPGPFEVQHIRTYESGRHDEYFCHEFIIITPSTVDHDNEIGIATAKLISAAPELLAALERILSDSKSTDYDGGFSMASLIQAEAAIKKAKGL